MKVHRKFESWGQFVKSASDFNNRQWDYANCKSQTGEDGSPHSTSTYGGDNWFGASFTEAVNLAIKGWPQGLKKLRSVQGTIPEHRAVRLAMGYDVAGEYPDIGRAIGGDPMCMTTRAPSRRAATPIIAIVLHISHSSRISGSSIINHGAAVMSYIDALENAGYRVELHIHGAAKAGEKRYYITVPLKLAHEHLDRDRVMFATTHPSTLRRLSFAIVEQHSELETYFKYGYGQAIHGTDYPDDDLPNAVNIHVLEHNVNADEAFTQLAAKFENYLA